MNNLYNFIINGATTDLEKLFMIVIFMMVFEGIMDIIVELLRMGRGK